MVSTASTESKKVGESVEPVAAVKDSVSVLTRMEDFLDFDRSAGTGEATPGKEETAAITEGVIALSSSGTAAEKRSQLPMTDCKMTQPQQSAVNEQEVARALHDLVIRTSDGQMAASQLCPLLYDQCEKAKSVLKSHGGLKRFTASKMLEHAVDYVADQGGGKIVIKRKQTIKKEQKVEVVESMQRLKDLLEADAALRGEVADRAVAIDCKGAPGALHLLQVATTSRVLLLDCKKMGAQETCEAIRQLLTSDTTIKLIHDVHNQAAAIASLGGVKIRGCLDTQLAMEFLFGTVNMGFSDMLKQLGCSQLSVIKATMMARTAEGKEGPVLSQRQLAQDAIEHAALAFSLQRSVHTRLVDLLGPDMANVKKASDLCARNSAESGGRRCVCVNVSNHQLASRELMEVCRPAQMLGTTVPVVSDDVQPLLLLLPSDISGELSGLTSQLSDVVLDKGRRPHAWSAGKRIFLGCHDRVVTSDDLNTVVTRVGDFGSDNRAGLEAQLHRISAIRNRGNHIIGLTMRVGRHVSGNAHMIADLLFRDDASILFLGEPGSGKTTIVREVTRLLAETRNVLIVDTSNEIAGDGDVPHPCVGLARRMHVRSLAEQGDVMIEGVQNHTPEVMVIDEIGRQAEVDAARTCKQRGVRMIASAHGDLRKLIKNKELRGLVGGLEKVTLGDAQAKEEAKKHGQPPDAPLNKLKTQRAGSPIFDVVIELRRGELHDWRIVSPCAAAVDSILEGARYEAQRRTRDDTTGEFFLELEHN